jgi:alkylation response protein AidB-like acyl-CoA dehydrogenase
VAEYDSAETLPLELVAKMADLGLFGGVVAPEHGGMGLDLVTFAAVTEEIARVCQALAPWIT